MSRADVLTPGPPSTSGLAARRTTDALRTAAPPLLFGLRLWASVCLALYVAFSLELDNSYWAGTSAAIVCQPQLGASLRKASFRMIGTIIGAAAIVVLTALFPQDRVGFLLGLALWGAACGFMATILRNFAAYGAALAGFTAVIVASDELGPTGAPSPHVIILAIDRASEICIGIVCAGLVLAGTDFGAARRRLAAQFAAIAAEIAGRIAAAFAPAGADEPDSRPVRRDLIRRVSALDPIIDTAIGEDSELRYRSRILQTAVGGLFAALSRWRIFALHLERLPSDQGRREAKVILRNFPRELQSTPTQNLAANWLADPSGARRACAAAARALTHLSAEAPSLRLLADNAAEALLGVARALNGLALLVDPGRAISGPRTARLHAPDQLPAVINATRVFVTIAAVELFWVATAWPSGAQAVTFAAIVIILFSPQAELAYPSAVSFLFGVGLSAALAAIVKFAVLPQIATFAGFCLAIGFVLVPIGSLVAQPWRSTIFVAATANFIPLLAPSNRMIYDTQQFYNSALAILAGVGAAALAIRLLPPPSPDLRARRLLDLTRRDLRRLAMSLTPCTRDEWERRVYARLIALPEQAEPLQRAQLAAALSVGGEIIRLRAVAPRFKANSELDAALAELALGQSATSIERLAELDQTLAAAPNAALGAQLRLRARASILAMSEALAEYGAYFDAGTLR